MGHCYVHFAFLFTLSTALQRQACGGQGLSTLHSHRPAIGLRGTRVKYSSTDRPAEDKG